MAKAYACDRCGVLFKESDYKGFIPVILDDGVLFNVRFINLAGTQLALCPKCVESFRKWWNEDAAHKSTDYKAVKGGK